MEEIKVTWKYAAKVWWSWSWRATLWVIPITIVASVVSVFIMALAGISTESYQIYLEFIGVFIVLFFGIYTMKVILTKNFNGYRIALVKTDGCSSTSDE